MFDMGFLEVTTIGVVALVVIGPERLPEVAAKVGRYVGKAQRFVRGVRSDISRELETGDLKNLLNDQKSQIDDLRKMVHTATKDIESSTSGAMKDAQNSIGDLKSEISDSSSDASTSTEKEASSSAAASTAASVAAHEPELLNTPSDTGQTKADDDSKQQSN